MKEFLSCLETYNGAVTAAATVFIAMFTIVLACVTRKQLRIANGAIKLAREEFISTHRPILKIRRMVFKKNGALDFGPDELSHGDKVTITIDVVNVGGISTWMVKGWYSIIFSKGTPTHPTETDRRNLTDGQSISFAVGQRRSFELEGIARLKDQGCGMRVMRQFKVEGWSMFVLGEIRYRDDAESERSTGFARSWGRDGFERLNNPDYDYED